MSAERDVVRSDARHIKYSNPVATCHLHTIPHIPYDVNVSVHKHMLLVNIISVYIIMCYNSVCVFIETIIMPPMAQHTG